MFVIVFPKSDLVGISWTSTALDVNYETVETIRTDIIESSAIEKMLRYRQAG